MNRKDILKLIVVCAICIGVVVGAVFLIQWLAA